MFKKAIVLIALTFNFFTLSLKADPSADELKYFPVLKEAIQHQGKGNFRKALKLFNYAYENEIARFNVIPNIITCHTRLGNRDAVVKFLNQAIADYPFEVSLRYRLSELLFEYNRIEDAIVQLDLIEKMNLKDFTATLKKADLYRSLNQYQNAIPVYTQYITNAKPTEFTPYLNRGISYFFSGTYDLAEKDFKKAYEIRPSNPEVLFHYAKTLQASRKFPEAETLSKQTADFDSQNPVVWSLRAEIALALKKTPLAIDYFKEAIRLDPKMYEARFKLANVFVSTNQLADADIQFANILDIRPDHEESLKAWMPTLMARQDYVTAKRHLTTFHKKHPGNTWASVELAKLLGFANSNENASDVMSTNLKNTDSDFSRYYLAYFEYKSANYGKSEDILEDIKDAKLPTLFHLGLVQFKNEDYKDAIKTLNKISAEDSSWNKSQVLIAAALIKEKEIDQAWDKVNSVTPSKEIQNTYTQLVTYLNDIKSRQPANESKYKNLPDFNHDIQLDWELPSL